MAAMFGDTMRTEPYAWSPFNASPLQANQQLGASLPQGGDFGIIAQQIAGRVAQQLPGLIMNLMASSPQLSQAIRQQGGFAGTGPGGLGFGHLYGGQQYGQPFQPQQFGQFQPQLYGQQWQPQQFGQFQPQLYGQQWQPQQFGQFQPQLHGQQWQPQQFGQYQPQQYGQQFQPQQFGLHHQQGIDLGVVQQLSGMVAQQLPWLITNVLASSPQLSQAIRQQAASQMMGAYGGAVGFNPFGAGPQQPGYFQQQGSDLASMAQQIAGTVAQQLPGMITNVFASSPHLWGSGGVGSTAIH